MNIKAIITMLVLGSSSVALAEPARVNVEAQWHTPAVDVRDHRTVDVRDHRELELSRPVYQPVVYQPAADNCDNVRIGAKASAYVGPVGSASEYGGWIALTQPTKIGHGGEEITVGAAKGRFKTLQLTANSGDTYVQQVVIEFTNGHYQTVPLTTTLDANNPALTIALNGKRIARIIVEGSSGYGARYSILAA